MNNTLTHQPTLMQKLLGRNYKWWFAIIYSFKLSYEYRLSIFIAIIRFFIPVFITYILLSLTSSNKSFAEYTIIASIYYQFFAFTIGPSFDITNDVLKGSFSKYMLFPTDYIGILWTKILGFNFLTLTLRLIALSIVIKLIGVNFNFSSFLNSLILIPVIVLVGFRIETLLGLQVFFNQQLNKNILPFVYDLMPFLAGSLFSFGLSSNLEILKYTPMSFFAFHPMQIYLGKYDFYQTLMVFVGGIAWCVVLYFLAKFVFRMGLKRNEAVGL